jgi:hypothetical protein
VSERPGRREFLSSTVACLAAGPAAAAAREEPKPPGAEAQAAVERAVAECRHRLLQGLDPAIRFTRTKTLMMGDDRCDHAYELSPGQG